QGRLAQEHRRVRRALMRLEFPDPSGIDLGRQSLVASIKPSPPGTRLAWTRGSSAILRFSSRRILVDTLSLVESATDPPHSTLSSINTPPTLKSRRHSS